MKNKVLVIDDEQSMRKAISRQLSTDKDGFEIFSACNGKEGLKLYEKEHPILIILDIEMPLMDGIEFLEEIKLTSSSPFSTLVLTGKVDDKYIKKCFDLGVSAFLKKPFNNYEFMGLVKNTIALKRAQHRLKEEIAYRKLTQKALADQKETFISVLMHDLKNPLIPLVTYCRKLAEGKINSDEEKIKKLKIMRESSERVLEIIESTSDVLKKGRAVPPICVNKVVISDTVLFVVKNAKHEADEKRISIYINGKSENEWDNLEEIIICADEHQIRSLVENLAGNAMKYARSSINIELANINDDVKLVVRDDGRGIKEIYHKKIFDSYFQAPGSKKGTGLGLFSVKKVVDNHNGRINVHSAPEAGTSFEVILPIND